MADAASEPRHGGGLMARVKRVIAAIQRTALFRAFMRFTAARGNLLSGGMSFQALFAILAALWLGFAIAGVWLVANPALLDSMISTLNQAVPGLIGPEGAVSRSALAQATGTLGWTGIIAAIGLIMTTIGWLSSTREAVRAMFQVGEVGTNVVLQKLRDLALGFGFGVFLVVASVLSLLTTAILEQVYALLGISSRSPLAGVITGIASFVVTTVINAVVLMMMYRVLSAVVIRWRRLIIGALAGAVILTVMSALSGLLLGGARRNPLAASFAVVLGLLIWFNLVSRVMLLCASWIAVGMPHDSSDDPAPGSGAQSEAQSGAQSRQERELDALIVLAEGAVSDRADAARAARWPRRRSSRRRARNAARTLASLRRQRSALDRA